MSFTTIDCPECGAPVRSYRNPAPTVDIIIEVAAGIILIYRKNEPKGWALPGGFVDYGESLQTAAIREAQEETSLRIDNLRLVGCYSDPARDPRQHTITTVYAAVGHGTPKAADDAAELTVFSLANLPEPLCFDHRDIIADYQSAKAAGRLDCGIK